MTAIRLSVLLCVLGAGAVVAATFAADTAKPSREEAAKQLAALLKERRDTLVQLVKIVTTQYQEGAVPFEMVSAATERLSDAEIDMATTRAERIAACEKKVRSLKGCEDFFQGRFNQGFRTTKLELLEAKAARLKAQVQLARETAAEN